MRGRDKSQLEVAGQSILELQLELLRPFTERVALVGESTPNRQGLERVGDRVGGLGPLDGIAGALEWAESRWLLVIACDMPRIRATLVAKLLTLATPEVEAIAIEKEGQLEPLLACYHPSILPRLDACLARRELSARGFLRGLRTEVMSEEAARKLDPKLESLTNINSMEDLHRLQLSDSR